MQLTHKCKYMADINVNIHPFVNKAPNNLSTKTEVGLSVSDVVICKLYIFDFIY